MRHAGDSWVRLFRGSRALPPSPHGVILWQVAPRVALSPTSGVTGTPTASTRAAARVGACSLRVDTRVPKSFLNHHGTPPSHPTRHRPFLHHGGDFPVAVEHHPAAGIQPSPDHVLAGIPTPASIELPVWKLSIPEL